MRLNVKLKKLINSLFKDKNNHIVIWQYPNIPIFGWFIFMLMSHLLSNSKILSDSNIVPGMELISTAFLFTWAYLELIQGVNYFRRILGFIVLSYIVLSNILK